MGDLQEQLRNAAMTAGRRVYAPSNAPGQYASRQQQYYGDETTRFTEQYAQYASDYFKAEVQGLDPNDPTKWQTYYLRMADVGKATMTTTHRMDDFKRVLFADRKVDYLKPGCKIVAMGSTWLAVNPNNISGVGAGGVVQRCNAVWNHLDWYGNVLSEPLAVDRYLARANNTDTQEAMNLTKGYFDVKCQNNAETAQLGENSRMILGSGGYHVTGFSDFLQEFTGDYSTVRLLEFSIRYEEPNYTIDDMVNHVAGGLEFSWDITVSGKPNLLAGDTAQFTAASRRNGKSVSSTQEHPIGYVWSSSDTEVATVDENGLVTAVGEGTCTITATLAQNGKYSASFSVSVENASAEGSVRFLTTVPETLAMYDSVTLTAAYFNNGEQTDNALTWLFDGADSEDYTAAVNGNSVTITCYGGSVKPLVVVASYDQQETPTFPAQTLFPDDGVYPQVYEASGYAAARITLEGF